MKQETLEEAAKNYENSFSETNGTEAEDFINGAKWQQEQMYTQEEVIEIISNFHKLKLNEFKNLLDLLELKKK